MDDKRFDNIIKKKVDGFTSIEESDWSDFSSMLEAQSANEMDQDFDEKIKTELSDLQEEFQASHWEILKEKLEIEEYIRTRLYLIKGIELSILILIYMGFSSMFNPIEDIQNRLAPPVAISKTFVQIQPAPELKEKIEDQNFTDGSQLAKLGIDVQKINVEKVLEVYKQGSQTSIERNTLSNENSSIISGQNIIQKLLSTSKSTEGKETLTIDKPIAAAIHKSEFKQNALANTVSKESLESNFKDQSKLLHADKLETTISSLEISRNIEALTYSFVSLKPIRDYERDGKYVWMSSSFNGDIIDSPNDNVYPNYLSYLSYSKGYSASFGILNRFGNWDLGMGARYTQQAYSPRLISETTGGVAQGTKTTTLEKIAYDVVSLPFTADYRLVQKNSWSLFATAALSINAIGFATYVAQEEVNRRPYRRYNILDKKQIDQELDYLSQKEFELGLFEGGTLIDNLYLTGSAGLGIEKFIGPNTVISLSTKYRHQLFSAKVGPNDDKIHSLVWTLGAKYKI